MQRKKTNLALLFLVFGFSSFSQSSERAVEIIQSQTIYINSVFSTSGKSRKVISIDLPANTIRWYYSLSAFRSQQDIQNIRNSFNLMSKLSYIIDQTGTTANAISLLGSPPGSNCCDIYLLGSSRDVSVFETKNDYFGKSLYYIRQGSRQNFMSGVVDITEPSCLSGRQYLGLKNTDLKNGVNVTIQVVAITYNEPTINGWNASVKQEIYDKIKAHLANSLADKIEQREIINLSGCIMSKLTKSYTPEAISAYAKYELNGIFAKFAENCSNELNLNLSNVNLPNSEIDESHIIGTWHDQNSTFSIYQNGTMIIRWDNGNSKSGKWNINGRNLQFILNNGGKIDNYKIILLTNSKLRYKNIGNDLTIWDATKTSEY